MLVREDLSVLYDDILRVGQSPGKPKKIELKKESYSADEDPINIYNLPKYVEQMDGNEYYGSVLAKYPLVASAKTYPMFKVENDFVYPKGGKLLPSPPLALFLNYTP